MEKYMRFENIDNIICENHIIKLYGEELMMFKSFCNAVFGEQVQNLDADCRKEKYCVNNTWKDSYGFSELCKYIKQRFDIKNIFSLHFCDGILRIKAYYTYDGKNGVLVCNGKYPE